MKLHPVKFFIKDSYKNLLGSIIYIAVLCFLFKSVLFVIWLLIVMVLDYFNYDKKLEERKRLAAKGLTEQDIINIQFVKEWESNHAKGRLKFAFADGIIGGLMTLIPVSALLYYFVYSRNKSERLFDEFGDMMGFIGYSILLSIAIGIIYHYCLWPFKERRFKQLTNPISVSLNS